MNNSRQQFVHDAKINLTSFVINFQFLIQMREIRRLYIKQASCHIKRLKTIHIQVK